MLFSFCSNKVLCDGISLHVCSRAKHDRPEVEVVLLREAELIPVKNDIGTYCYLCGGDQHARCERMRPVMICKYLVNKFRNLKQIWLVDDNANCKAPMEFSAAEPLDPITRLSQQSPSQQPGPGRLTEAKVDKWEMSQEAQRNLAWLKQEYTNCSLSVYQCASGIVAQSVEFGILARRPHGSPSVGKNRQVESWVRSESRLPGVSGVGDPWVSEEWLTPGLNSE